MLPPPDFDAVSHSVTLTVCQTPEAPPNTHPTINQRRQPAPRARLTSASDGARAFRLSTKANTRLGPQFQSFEPATPHAVWPAGGCARPLHRHFAV